MFWILNYCSLPVPIEHGQNQINGAVGAYVGTVQVNNYFLLSFKNLPGLNGLFFTDQNQSRYFMSVFLV